MRQVVLTAVLCVLMAGCGKEMPTGGEPPPPAPPPPRGVTADHNVYIDVKKTGNKCSGTADPAKLVGPKKNQTVLWQIRTIDARCVDSEDLLVVSMKNELCNGTEDRRRPIRFDAPQQGYQTGKVKDDAINNERTCYRYAVSIGAAYIDPEFEIVPP